MIYIDESGWGSLIGGVAIGLYNSGTGEFYSEIIPVKFFKGKKFKSKGYLNEAYRIVIEGLGIILSDDKITICRGYILSKVREYFDRYRGYKWKTGEIGQPLQGYLENVFSDSLKKIGIKAKSEGAHCLSFDDQLKWVKARKTRVKYVKTGWESWKKKYSKLGKK